MFKSNVLANVQAGLHDATVHLHINCFFDVSLVNMWLKHMLGHLLMIQDQQSQNKVMGGKQNEHYSFRKQLLFVTPGFLILNSLLLIRS